MLSARYNKKPPLGVKPAYLNAYPRIKELAEAIARYADDNGDIHYIALRACEIESQCEIIKRPGFHFNPVCRKETEG